MDFCSLLDSLPMGGDWILFLFRGGEGDVHVCLCVYVSVGVSCVHVCLYLCVSMCVCMCMSVCLCVCGAGALNQSPVHARQVLNHQTTLPTLLLLFPTICWFFKLF